MNVNLFFIFELFFVTYCKCLFVIFFLVFFIIYFFIKQYNFVRNGFISRYLLQILIKSVVIKSMKWSKTIKLKNKLRNIKEEEICTYPFLCWKSIELSPELVVRWYQSFWTPTGGGRLFFNLVHWLFLQAITHHLISPGPSI